MIDWSNMNIDIRLEDVASSNIKDIKFVSKTDNSDMIPYNRVEGTLTIVYSNGAMYNYFNVPITHIGNLFIHESVGKYVAAHIKQLFESEKVGD